MVKIPALNFKKGFAEKVKSGAKRQTIRALRKDGRDPRVGQTLYLKTGMRTKNCQALGEFVCKSTNHIVIDFATVLLGGKRLTNIEALTLAVADGFYTRKEFQDFFDKHYGFPFHGIVIFW